MLLLAVKLMGYKMLDPECGCDSVMSLLCLFSRRRSVNTMYI